MTVIYVIVVVTDLLHLQAIVTEVLILLLCSEASQHG